MADDIFEPVKIDADETSLFLDEEAREKRSNYLESYYLGLGSLAVAISFKGLASVRCEYDPKCKSFSLSVFPVNTTSFNCIFNLMIFHEFSIDFDQDFQESMQNLKLARHFLLGLLDSGKPLLMYESQEIAS